MGTARFTPLSVALLLGLSQGALAAGEQGQPIRDVRVVGNSRTSSPTVRALVDVPTSLGPTTLEDLRLDLLQTRLFADAHAFWEPQGKAVRVTLVAADRWPWAPVPSFARAPGSSTGALTLAHRNVFGEDLEARLHAFLGTAESGAEASVDASHGLWGFLMPHLKAGIWHLSRPEFGNGVRQTSALRNTDVTLIAAEVGLGLRIADRFVPSIGYRIERARIGASGPNPANSALDPNDPYNSPAAQGRRRALLQFGLGFEQRKHEGPRLLGQAVQLEAGWAKSAFGGARGAEDFRVGLSLEKGVAVLERHNFQVRSGVVLSQDQPLWHELAVDSASVRGVPFRRYLGDTRATLSLEHHMPLLNPGPFALRGLLFADAAALWWRKLPGSDQTQSVFDRRADGRLFLPATYQKAGFDIARDTHASAGAGLRLYYRQIPLPLVGLDVAYAFREKGVAVLVNVGAGI